MCKWQTLDSTGGKQQATWHDLMHAQTIDMVDLSNGGAPMAKAAILAPNLVSISWVSSGTPSAVPCG